MECASDGLETLCAELGFEETFTMGRGLGAMLIEIQFKLN